jgi:hypothetical protein
MVAMDWEPRWRLLDGSSALQQTYRAISNPKFSTIASACLILAACGRAMSATVDLDARQYRYVLVSGRDVPVCVAMTRVINERFTRPWDVDWSSSEFQVETSGGGRFTFPTLPGVTHFGSMSASMVFSKVPSSPEFERIKWKEGRAYVMPCGGQFPLLVAENDIDSDSDGKMDTIVKISFSGSLDQIADMGSTRGMGESTITYRNERRRLPALVDLADLYKRSDGGREEPLLSYRTLYRPFILKA